MLPKKLRRWESRQGTAEFAQALAKLETNHAQLKADREGLQARANQLRGVRQAVLPAWNKSRDFTERQLLQEQLRATVVELRTIEQRLSDLEQRQSSSQKKLECMYALKATVSLESGAKHCAPPVIMPPSEDVLLRKRCLTKSRYPSEDKARHTAASFSWKYRELMSAYPCTDCGGWHLARKRTGGRMFKDPPRRPRKG